MIIGDINELSSSHGKRTNHKGNSTRYNKSKKIVNGNGLVDIGHIGLPYIWWDNRTHLDAVFERLESTILNPH